MAREAFLINPSKSKPPRKKIKAKARKNPLGEEILIVGGNPVKKRRKKASSHRANPVSSSPKRSVHRRSYRHPSRRYRRNPPGRSLAMPSIKKPTTLIMPMLIGVGAKITAEKVPQIFKLQGTSKAIVQMSVAVGGTMLLKDVLGDMGATIWLAVAGATALSSLLEKSLFKGLSGVEDDISYNPYVKAPQLIDEQRQTNEQEQESLPSPYLLENSMNADMGNVDNDENEDDGDLSDEPDEPDDATMDMFPDENLSAYPEEYGHL